MQWRNWRGAGGRDAPCKVNVKSGPPAADILVQYLVFFMFTIGCFFAIFELFFVFLASADIHDFRIHYHFLGFFSECSVVAPYR